MLAFWVGFLWPLSWEVTVMETRKHCQGASSSHSSHPSSHSTSSAFGSPSTHPKALEIPLKHACWDKGNLLNTFWTRKQQPTSVFLPGKSNGHRSLMVYSPWGCKASDTTEHAPIQKQPCKSTVAIRIRLIKRQERWELRIERQNPHAWSTY